MQQQSVLILALRGPDNVRKHHPCKQIQRYYRGTVLNAAKYGRLLENGEKADTFMSMTGFNDYPYFSEAVRDYFDHVDELPHHFHMHLAHGAEILGYKHPDEWYRQRWFQFYHRACEDLHLNFETEDEMDARLNDWGREAWDIL